MALIYRNGRPYLYQSIRWGEWVTTEYVASGEDALLLARLQSTTREMQDYWRREEREERTELDDLEHDLDDLTEQALTLARNALERAGYHQHHRGEWRRRRESRTGEVVAQRPNHGLLRGEGIACLDGT
jgi:hypothetical protein